MIYIQQFQHVDFHQIFVFRGWSMTECSVVSSFDMILFMQVMRGGGQRKVSTKCLDKIESC